MKRYADDYDIEVIEDEKGREKKIAVYHGKYFEVESNQRQLIAFKRILILLFFVMIGLHITNGFVANPGMYQFYVALPYAASFLPMYYLISGILRLPKEKRGFRRDEIGLSFDRLKKAGKALLIILGIGAIGEIVFLIFFATGAMGREVLYLTLTLMELAAVFIILYLRKQQKIIECSEE